MKVAVSGSNGLIGRNLARALADDGHEVTRLVRRSAPAAGPGEISWDPLGDRIDAAALEGHDAVVHLAGPSIGAKRWTEEYKRFLRDTRVKGTDLLARTLASLDRPPATMVSASAVGYYGDRGDEELTEQSPPGRGFFADLVVAWEEAAAPAASAGIRVASIRSGVVQAEEGGALGDRMLLPFKLGVAGRLGSGKQWFSWISLDDEIAAIRHVLATESLSGPINLTSPNPVTNDELTKALGRVLKRPTFMPVPTVALFALYGRELVEETILGGQRVLPAKLEASGFQFRYPEITTALAHVLDRPLG